MTANALVLTNKNWLTPNTDIDQYIAKVRQIPALDAEEERKLAIALQETNDINAAQTLIVHHLKFVVHIARGFTGYGLPLGDLIQEGNVGLMKRRQTLRAAARRPPRLLRRPLD